MHLCSYPLSQSYYELFFSAVTTSSPLGFVYPSFAHLEIKKFFRSFLQNSPNSVRLDGIVSMKFQVLLEFITYNVV